MWKWLMGGLTIIWRKLRTRRLSFSKIILEFPLQRLVVSTFSRNKFEFFIAQEGFLGRLPEINVIKNCCDHLARNIYTKFKRYQDAKEL